MDINKIKNEIQNSKKYEFMKYNEHLGDNIIYITLGGSYSYGTNTEKSDIDIRGIVLERKEELMGLSNFDQFINEQTDTVVYGLKKIVKLLMNCNPNIIEMLGTKEEHIIYVGEEGQLLRDNLDMFLSKKCISSFGGYATAQLNRIKNALARDSYSQEESENHILEVIEKKLINLKEHYSDYTKSGNILLYIDDSEKESYDKEIFVDIELKHFPLRDFKNIYNDMNEVTKQYGKMGSRNKKKDEASLFKHAMHLIRLLEMGTEILEGKGVKTYRENREDLLDIRNGKYTLDEIFELADEKEKIFKYAGDNTALPKRPKYNEIEEMIMDIYSKKL